MPRLLAVGHVTRDRVKAGTVLGGTVSYAALTALRLGWEAGMVTAAGPEFDPKAELPGIAVFAAASPATTRFVNDYDASGRRQQMLSARAALVDVSHVPPEWLSPDVLLLGPVAAELPVGTARAFQADVVGAIAQGWLRTFLPDGTVVPGEWADPGRDLEGVHVLFLSEHDVPEAREAATEMLARVPIVVLTRGWRGALVLTRQAILEVPTLPRAEVDPTGAGDVFAAAFLLRYHEAGDLGDAAAFACCAASCAVEGVGTSTLGDRAEIEHRLRQRERLIEEGDWDE